MSPPLKLPTVLDGSSYFLVGIVASPVTVRLSLIVVSDVVFPIEIGTEAVVVPIVYGGNYEEPT